MTDPELQKLICDYANGTISPQQHQVLEDTLKGNPKARAVFREWMDLEASLHTWASEDAAAPLQGPHEPVRRERQHAERLLRGRPFLSMLLVAASIALFAVAGWIWRQHRDSAGELAKAPQNTTVAPLVCLGTAARQKDCVWSSASLLPGSRFPAGALSLVSGVAEIVFDSGTNVLMEGPCELQVISADTAQLLAGNVVVHVTELSDGFTLRTPDATILDEGTEYAVSLDDDATEIHVFDGSVFWEPSSSTGEDDIERITAGEARRYLRSKPGKGQRIPLKKVRFVRRIESDVRDSAGVGLLGYDGFENLAGRVQRGRSGFGWSGGWKAGYRGHGEMGMIVEAPDDTVFGMPRSRRRLLRLAHGQVMRRDLEQPVPLLPGETYYVSFLVQRHPGEADSGRFLQVSLYSDDEHPGRRSRNELAIGITSDGFPFVKSGGRITQSAPAIEDDTVYLCVAKFIVSHEQHAQTCLRVYREGELIEQYEPSAWTAVGMPGQCESSLSRVRLTAGDNALFDIDELKVGKTWRSVTAFGADGEQLLSGLGCQKEEH